MANNKISVLAIDDNRENLIVLEALVLSAFPDAAIFTASAGQAGYELAETENPDVILLDVVMPGMDGYEFCRKLKADKGLNDIPVIFVTAIKENKESRIRALECGAEAFLTKPVDKSELIAQIRAMVKIKAANAEKRDEKQRLTELVEERTRELVKTYQESIELYEALKRENENRKRSESALLEAQHMAHIGSFEFDAVKNTFTCTDEALATCGILREEFDENPYTIYKHVCQQDREHVILRTARPFPKEAQSNTAAVLYGKTV